MGKKLKLSIIITLLLIPFIFSALDVGIGDDEIGINLIPTITSKNLSTTWVNASDFWDNLDTPTDILTSLLNNDAGFIKNNTDDGYVGIFDEIKVGNIKVNGNITAKNVTSTNLYVGRIFDISGGAIDLENNLDGLGKTIRADVFEIGTTELSQTEWDYLDGINQPLKTTSSPTFVTIDATNIDHTGGVTFQDDILLGGNDAYANSFIGSSIDSPAGADADLTSTTQEDYTITVGDTLDISMNRTSIDTTSNFINFNDDDINTTGNMSARYFKGDGSKLTGIITTGYDDTNVAFVNQSNVFLKNQNFSSNISLNAGDNWLNYGDGSTFNRLYVRGVGVANFVYFSALKFANIQYLALSSTASAWTTTGNLGFTSATGFISFSPSTDVRIASDNKPLTFGTGLDFDVLFDGTNAIYNVTTGSGTHKFYNKSGLAIPVAHDWGTASPSIINKGNRYEALPENSLDEFGKLILDNNMKGVTWTTIPDKDYNNCNEVVVGYEYCYILTTGEEVCLNEQILDWEEDKTIVSEEIRELLETECLTIPLNITLTGGIALENRDILSNAKQKIIELEQRIQYLEENCVIK